VIPYAFHPEAEAELIVASLFFETRVMGLGTSFADAVERTVAFIRQYPDVGTPVGQLHRRVLVRGFPYSIVYERQPEQVLIPAVAHHRQRPGYWQHRP
jgi:hypothetical protein